MFSTLDDHEVDALLAGDMPADEELAPIAEVALALRRSAAAEPVPPMNAALLDQLAHPPVVALDTRRAVWSSLAKASAAAAVAAAVALVGVGASQNRLPTGLQDVVSSTADVIGLDVPRTDERGTEHRSDAGDDHAKDGTAPNDDGSNDGTPGYDGTTPGGADPADPGTPGDLEPATPATPPAEPGQADTEHPTASNSVTPSSTVPDVPEGPANGTRTTR